MNNIVIIGSGPAGYTAAIYTSRAMLEPVLIKGNSPGGQLMLSYEIENFPAFPKGISGPDLMDLHQKQAERFGTEVKQDHVSEVDFSSRPFHISCANGYETECSSVIIATGASARYLGLDSEEKLKGKGVSACATCDGAFFKDKKVVIVGGGDSAMEDALFMTRYTSDITVIHRRDELRASKIMQKKALDNDKINFLWNTEATEVLGVDQDRVTGVRLKNNKTSEESEMDCEGFFVAIGHTPNTDIFSEQVGLDEKGYIQITKRTRTSIEGVFAAGDCVDYFYRQAVTAAGMGCKAAMDAEKFLKIMEENNK